MEITVDTTAIATAISDAITEALDSIDIGVDGDSAATAISTAITNAFGSIELPAVQLESDAVTVSLDVPTNGIPIDTSALSSLDLGNAVGADIRNRLELAEGSITSLREDTNTILDTVESVDLSVIPTLETNLLAATETTTALTESVRVLESNVSEQERRILDRLEFRLNEELSASTVESNVNNRVDWQVAGINLNITQLDGKIKEALRAATAALAKASVRV